MKQLIDYIHIKKRCAHSYVRAGRSAVLTLFIQVIERFNAMILCCFSQLVFDAK